MLSPFLGTSRGPVSWITRGNGLGVVWKGPRVDLDIWSLLSFYFLI
jgi:hypothetical protein